MLAMESTCTLFRLEEIQSTRQSTIKISFDNCPSYQVGRSFACEHSIFRQSELLIEPLRPLSRESNQQRGRVSRPLDVHTFSNTTRLFIC